MKQFFQFYADPFALFFSLAAALVLSIVVWFKSKRRTRVLALPFFFFGPLLLMVCMLLHISENLFHAVEQYQSGAFVYNFRLYALILFGIVLGLQSWQLFLNCLRHTRAPLSNWNGLLKSSGLVVLISLPTFPFIPIGVAPAIACAITLTASLLVRKRKGQKTMLQSIQHGMAASA